MKHLPLLFLVAACTADVAPLSQPAPPDANTQAGTTAAPAAGAGATVPQPSAAGRAATPPTQQPTAGRAAPLDAGPAPQRPEDDAGAEPPTMPTMPAMPMPAANGCNDTVLCEDFEGATTLDPAKWESVAPNCMGDAEAALDPSVAHSGKHAAKVRAAGGYCNHLFLQPKLAAELPSPLFARFYVRFEKPFSQAHVTFLAMRDATDDKDLRMGGQSEILMWNRESDDATLPELSPSGIAMSVKPAAQTWICVELEVDAASASLRTWIDGKPISGLAVEGDPTPDVDAQWKRKPDWAPKLQNIKLGWESYGDQANTVWFDDIALGAARIGCNP